MAILLSSFRACMHMWMLTVATLATKATTSQLKKCHTQETMQGVCTRSSSRIRWPTPHQRRTYSTSSSATSPWTPPLIIGIYQSWISWWDSWTQIVAVSLTSTSPQFFISKALTYLFTTECYAVILTTNVVEMGELITLLASNTSWQLLHIISASMPNVHSKTSGGVQHNGMNSTTYMYTLFLSSKKSCYQLSSFHSKLTLHHVHICTQYTGL